MAQPQWSKKSATRLEIAAFFNSAIGFRFISTKSRWAQTISAAMGATTAVELPKEASFIFCSFQCLAKFEFGFEFGFAFVFWFNICLFTFIHTVCLLSLFMRSFGRFF